MCGHSSKYGSEITHYLHACGFTDEETGSVDQVGWYGLIRGSIAVEADAMIEYGLTWEDVEELAAASGAIVQEDNYGFVCADLYSNDTGLRDAWAKILADTTHNACDECGGEAEYIGADQDVVHTTACSQRPPIHMMGVDMPLSDLIHDGSLMATVDGGYPLAYITRTGDELCAPCATENDRDFPHDLLIGADVLYEGGETGTDCSNCHAQIIPPDEAREDLCDSEPTEGDITTDDELTWYQDGKVVVKVTRAELDEDSDAGRRAVAEHMDRDGFHPNVWVISDHGNACLIDVTGVGAKS